MSALNDSWRVTDSDDPAPYGQWQLQRIDRNGKLWRTQSWCQTRPVLERCIREKVISGAVFYPGSASMPVGEAAMREVSSLPAQHPRSGLRSAAGGASTLRPVSDT